MVKRPRRSNASINGAPVEAPSATLGPRHGPSLLEMPDALSDAVGPSATPGALTGTSLATLLPEHRDDIARRAIQLGAGGGDLSLTCRAFSKTNLLHAPALRIQLDSQGCDQFLTPRVVAALQARTCKLALTLEQQRAQSSRQYISLLTEVLERLTSRECEKLTSCAAVEACKLGTVRGPSLIPHPSSLKPLPCSPDLARHLMDAFPGLTSLSLHGYAIPCSGLATLLSHPQLSLQLQQLDLSSSTILKPKRPKPGAATLANLFNTSKLNQLSLSTEKMAGEIEPLLPNLQPLSQHLTQLCLQQREGAVWGLDDFSAALQPLAQLQVLTISCIIRVWELPGLLQALPQLHTLQLPDAEVWGQEQLDALLAATQLTSIQLSLMGLSSSHADLPCSWQRLELTGSVDCYSAAHLPLHALTQPLVLGELRVDTEYCKLVAAAVDNLTQGCSVPVRTKVLHLRMAGQRHERLLQLEALLQALTNCSWEKVYVVYMHVGAADVATLAPLCQGCTHLEFDHSGLDPSLEFWYQLVQLMPTVTHLTVSNTKGSDSAAMHQSLQLMADQPWARWLDICIVRRSDFDALPACWRASPLSQPGKLRVWFKTVSA